MLASGYNFLAVVFRYLAACCGVIHLESVYKLSFDPAPLSPSLEKRGKGRFYE
jgi:hypothetical protein